MKTKGNLRFVEIDQQECLLIGSEFGIYRLNEANEIIAEALPNPPMAAGTCLNDVALGANGELVVAVSDIAESNAKGGFYLLHDGNWTCLKRDIVVANGPAFDSKGPAFLLSDTLNKRILVHDLVTHETNPEMDLTNQTGYPDGLFMSDEGDLYISFWEGGRTDIYRDGQKIGEISLPGNDSGNFTCACDFRANGHKYVVITICDENPDFENGAYLFEI